MQEDRIARRRFPDLAGIRDQNGIAAGSLAGGLVLGGVGAAALPWVTLVFTVAALGTAGAARRNAFPPERRDGRGIPGRMALLPRA